MCPAGLTGFVEADGHFGVKYRTAKPKSETRKRSACGEISESVSLLFKLDQRSHDVANNCSMVAVRTIMKLIAYCLRRASASNLLTYKYKIGKSSEQKEALSISVTSVNDLKPMVDYFNKFPLQGTKYLDFKDSACGC